MFSFPSSTHSSILQDKQNMNPNGIRLKQAKDTPAQKERSEQLESGKSDQFISVYQSIGDQKNEVSDNSMKTLLQGFCSTIQETQENSETDNFKYQLTKMLNKEQITLHQFITYCLNNQVNTKPQMINVIRNPSILQLTNNLRINSNSRTYNSSCYLGNTALNNNTLRKALRTDLGELMIEDFCRTLQSSRSIQRYQEQLLTIIMPPDEEDITPSSVFQYYCLFKEEESMQKIQIQNLIEQYKVIYGNKLKPKLWSDHFRLELSTNLNSLQQHQKLSYRSLYKCLGHFLNEKQITTVFRYFYYVQTSLSMPIVDISKKLSLKSVKQCLLGESDIKFEFEKRKNMYDNEEKHRIMSRLEEQNFRQKQMITKKDRKIEQLTEKLEMMKLEKDQTQKILKSNFQLQLEGCRKKYERKIKTLEEQYTQQVKTTQWYQTELESIINALNKENVMRKFLQ